MQTTSTRVISLYCRAYASAAFMH